LQPPLTNKANKTKTNPKQELPTPPREHKRKENFAATSLRISDVSAMSAPHLTYNHFKHLEARVALRERERDKKRAQNKEKENKIK